jgi:hypothetical protein
MASNDQDNPYYKGQDAYQILDVLRSADKKTIKAAYRKGTQMCWKDLQFVPMLTLSTQHYYARSHRNVASGQVPRRRGKEEGGWYAHGEDQPRLVLPRRRR